MSGVGGVVNNPNVTLDAVGNPVNNASFTFPATEGLTVAGTAPASTSSGTGTAAGTLATVTTPAGGATTGTSTTGGTGGDVSITTGAGGSGSGGTNATGGRAGNITLQAGLGGANSGSGVAGADGLVKVVPGVTTNTIQFDDLDNVNNGFTHSAGPRILMSSSLTHGGALAIGIDVGTPCVTVVYDQDGANLAAGLRFGYQTHANVLNGTIPTNFPLVLNANGLNNGVVITSGGVTFVGGKAGFSSAGALNIYNNINLVGTGCPAQYGTADLTAQSAAKTATTLYTPTATGWFRISAYLKVTTAASTSSSLAGATGVTITYTDGTDSVAQSQVMELNNQAGAAVIVNAGNSTTTTLAGSLAVYAKTGVAIKYAIDYTSVGVTAMQYAARLRCEGM